MISTVSSLPVYIGHVDSFEKHLNILKDYIYDDSYWRTANEWFSETSSTINHDTNAKLPWNDILSDLDPHIQKYFKHFDPITPFGYEHTPWLNRYEKGSWQEQHNHLSEGSQFSMAYIIDAQQQNNFVFVDQSTNWYDMHPNLRQVFSKYPSRYFTPKQESGTILVFPSALDHFVMPNKSDNYRISASSNFHIRIKHE